MSSDKTQLVVVGGGPGGYTAAFLAADMGMQVSLIDREPNPGGVCLYRGCIPSKALLHAAKVMTEAKEAEAIGIGFADPRLDLDKLREWKESVVEKLTGGLGTLTRQRGIQYIRGEAVFLNADTLEIRQDGSKQTLGFDHAIIATGSSSVSLPNLNIQSDNVWDSTDALALKQVPKTMLIVGGGYIGMELGTVYAALGTRVSVVEMMDTIMLGTDPDLIAVYKRRALGLFEKIMLKTTVKNISEEKGSFKVRFEGEHEDEEVYDVIFTAIGRRPNSKNLGLKNTRVKTDDRGFIEINEQRQTTEPSIYAIGDVVGGPLLAHKAAHEGHTAVRAISGQKVRFAPKAIPGVVFTDPEVATCGLTALQAKKEGREIEEVKFPWMGSGRALTQGRTDGMTKLIIDPGSEIILGVGIVGPGAGELISEGVMAVEQGLKASDMAELIHPHPTLSETLMESAEMFYGECTHVYRPKRK